MQVVVLAASSVHAGEEQVPSVLVRVAGRPLVDFQLDRFVASGARSVVMCVGLQGEAIETHVRRALDRGLTVAYSYAGEQLTGTGGAVRRAFARLEREFVVTHGERYLPFDCAALLADLQAHPEASATLAVFRAPGDVAVEGELVTAYQKGQSYAHAGALALRRSVLTEIADGAVWELDALLRQLTRAGQLRAFVTPEPSLSVVTAEDRAWAERYLSLQASASP